MQAENNTRQRRTVSTGTWLTVLLTLVIFIVFPNAFMAGLTYMLVFAWTILAFFIVIWPVSLFMLIALFYVQRVEKG